MVGQKSLSVGRWYQAACGWDYECLGVEGSRLAAVPIAEIVGNAGTLQSGRLYGLALARFLLVAGWDGGSRPDFRVLLTHANIDKAFVVWCGTVGGQRAADYRTYVRWAARQVGTIGAGRGAAARVVPSYARPARWWQERARTCSWTHAAAASVRNKIWLEAAMPGYGFTLDQGAFLVVDSATAVLTFDTDVLQSSVVAMWQAGSVEPAQLPVQVKQRSKTISGRTQMRSVRKALQPTVVSAEALPQLPADIAAIVQRYRPQQIPDSMWGPVRDVWRLLVRAWGPASGRLLSARSRIFTDFCLWVRARRLCETGNPAYVLAGQDVVVHGLVDAFIDANAAGAAASIATGRSVLRKAVRMLQGLGAPGVYGRGNHKPPYSLVEIRQLVALATTQPTAVKSRHLCFAIGLGLGAGVAGADVRHLRRNHLICTTLDGQLVWVVQVPQPRPRVVVVRCEFAHLIDRAVELWDLDNMPDDGLLLGTTGTRSNPYSSAFTQRKDASVQPVELSGPRLRHSWMLAMMCAPVPVAVVLAAAGLASTSTMVKLASYCPTRADITITAAQPASQVGA